MSATKMATMNGLFNMFFNGFVKEGEEVWSKQNPLEDESLKDYALCCGIRELNEQCVNGSI